MVHRILLFFLVLSTSSISLFPYRSARIEVEVCDEIQFISKYQLNANGYDLFYFLLKNDTVLIAGRSDSIPIAGLQAGKVELLQRKKYRLPICKESTSAFLFPEMLAFKFPLSRGTQFFYSSGDVYIPKLIRVYSTNHINGGFINYRQCE